MNVRSRLFMFATLTSIAALTSITMTARATGTAPPSCTPDGGDAGNELAPADRLKAEQDLADAERRLTIAEANVETEQASRDGAIAHLTDADEADTSAARAVKALAKAESTRDELLQEVACLEADRDAVEYGTSHAFAVQLYGLGALGAGAVPDKIGGGLTFGWRANVTTEVETGVSVSRVGERWGERAVDVGFPFRVYFGRIHTEGISTALFLGAGLGFVTRHSTPLVLSGQLGVRILSRIASPTRDVPVLWNARFFLEPRAVAFDGPNQPRASTPVTVLFGLEMGFGLGFTRPSVVRHTWPKASRP